MKAIRLTYRGNGDSLTITLGFRPKFVVISAQYAAYSTSGCLPVAFLMAGDGVEISGIKFLDDGFTVLHTLLGNVTSPPHSNDKDRDYTYIAFR